MACAPLEESLKDKKRLLMKKQNAVHFELPGALRHDAQTLVEDAHALIEATAEITDHKVTEARKRLETALANGQEVYKGLRRRVIAGAQAADDAVQEHPYRAIGISFGVGVLLGILMKRRS